MAYDEGLAALLREALADEPGITERKMFGGLCFQRYGHMVGGVHGGGGMFRVGKPSHDAALAMEGVGPMTFTGRPMGGMVEAEDAVLEDEARLAPLLALALAHARSLPPK